MRPAAIITLIIALIALGSVFILLNDSDNYGDFSLARKHPGREYQIIGKLAIDSPMFYQAAINPDSFSFFLRDRNMQVNRIVYLGPKPQDFEKLDQIVLTGHWASDHFFAREMLLKCPSKYKSDTIPEGFSERKF